MKGQQIPLEGFEPSGADRFRAEVLEHFRWKDKVEARDWDWNSSEFMGYILFNLAASGRQGFLSATLGTKASQAAGLLVELDLLFKLEHPLHGIRYIATTPIRQRWEEMTQ